MFRSFGCSLPLWLWKTLIDYLCEQQAEGNDVFLLLPIHVQNQYQCYQGLNSVALPSHLCSKAIPPDMLDPDGIRASFWNCDNPRIDLPVYSCTSGMEQEHPRRVPQYDNLLVYKCRIFDCRGFDPLGSSHAGPL